MDKKPPQPTTPGSTQEKPPNFVFPSFRGEHGEIERVGKEFEFTQNNFTDMFLERARKGKLSELPEDVWASLDNTDSFHIKKDDWEGVAYHAESEKPPRDWKDLKHKMQNGLPIDAPVIAKIGNTFHKVGGNTRLMVARALGIVPQVLIVDITNLA